MSTSWPEDGLNKKPKLDRQKGYWIQSSPSRSSVTLLNAYDPSEMVFKPPIPIPKPIKNKGNGTVHIWRDKALEELSMNVLDKNLSLDHIDIFNEIKISPDQMEDD